MLQIKNTLGGGKPEGLCVWKKYEYTPDPYLSFLGNEEFTLKTYNTTKNWNGTLEYSTDTTTWNTWNGTEISSSGKKLYLRGTGNTVITGPINSGTEEVYSFIFTGTGTDTLRISCEGNIESLLDYITVVAGNHPPMGNNCFANLFYNCISLTTPPSILPATTLSENCYYGMFYGCTSLITTPVLPATILAASCYRLMFKNCTSLTKAPQLPATKLDVSCYREMFNNCTSLRIAPELPAIASASHCYRRMFYGCTNLITLPELSATMLAYRCYYQMFSNCSNIKLSEIQTEEYQIAYRIPSSGTGTEAPGNPSNALEGMFTNTSGTFTGTPIMNTTYYTSNTIV